jgi:hypothetical protein
MTVGIICSILLIGAVLIGVYFFLPPLDLVLAKARVGLFR